MRLCRSIRGGSSLNKYTHSRVANVEFATRFLTTNTQVTTLKLENLNLGPTINKLAPYFPPSVQYLYIGNDLITTFPTELATLKYLDYLYVRVIVCLRLDLWGFVSFKRRLTNSLVWPSNRIMGDNLITRVDASNEMSSLTVLYVERTGLSMFQCVSQLKQVTNS